MAFFQRNKKHVLLFAGFFLCFVLGGLFLSTFDVLAQQDTFGVQDVGEQINLGGTDIRVTIANIIRAVLGLLGIIAVIIVLYGGFVYMTSGGNEERIAQAKKILINGVIGLVIILSAFTIVQFVINQLSEAVGGPGTDTGDIPPSVCNVGSPDYNAGLCETLCDTNPNLSVCSDLAFYVKSITPSTPNGDATGMNNVVVRVLFSHPLAQGTDFLSALTIENADGDALTPVSVQARADRRILEVRYDLSGGLFPLDTYTIQINEDLTDVNGNGLLGSYGFGGLSFPLSAEANIDQSFEDHTPPDIGPIFVNGAVDAETVLYAGQTYTIDTLITDITESAPYGGISYVRISIRQAGSNTLVEEYYDGPNVENGSSAPFSANLTSVISQQFDPLNEYVVTVEAADIDNNFSEAQTSFIVYGNHCNNGVQDADETDIDAGGSCGGSVGDSCESDSDCSAALVCGIDNTCVGYPMIANVSPMDGAAGNWITISGNNFGTQIGRVQFAADANSNGQYDATEWVEAEIPACTIPGASSWNSDYVIATVPDAFAPDTQTSIRIIPSQGEPATPSLLDGAVTLDGNDDRISLNLPYDGGDTTLSAWYRTDDITTQRMALVGGVTDGRFEMYIHEGRPACRVFRSSETLLVAESIPSPNEWHHIVCTQQTQPTGETRLYVDGQLVESEPVTSIPSGGNWRVGQSGSTVGNAYVGFVDEVAIYDRNLSASEVQTLAMIGMSGTLRQYVRTTQNQNPAGYWHLNDQNGTIAESAAPSGPDGGYENGVGLGFAGAFLEKANAMLVDGVMLLADSTTNDIGPKPGNQNGQFTYNTTIRPGICSVVTADQAVFEQDGETVVIPAGANAAPAGTPVNVGGTGFGSSGVVSFGGAVNGSIASWTESLIQTSVPNNLNPGTLAVSVTANGEVSNGIPFTILSEEGVVKAPVISAIDPSETTPESFITILGNGFDGEGSVYIADTAQNVQTCDDFDPINRHASCQNLNVSALPSYCGDTWTDTEVIAEIPSGVSPGSYAVMLKNGLKLKTDGQDTLTIIAGPPRPSICRLDPSSGPAPLPSEADDLTISGTHFSGNPTVYFSTKETVLSDLTTWLSSAVDTINGQSVVTDADDEEIMTRIPVSDMGYSMPQGIGQIKVQSASGEVSNSVGYTVSDCRNQGADTFPGYQCCDAGPDAGSWIPESYICEGETRDAGYVWRFTTGLIPQIPEVIEQCNDVDFPSPTPFAERSEGENVCLNAEVGVRFSMDMDSDSFAGNVGVFTCGTGAAPDCDNKQPLTQTVTLSYINDTLRILVPNDFAANTWHRVELLDGIQSKEILSEFGQEVIRNQPLRATRPCGDGTSYCFEFRTGNGFCSLTDVGVSPSSHVTPVLGLLHRPPFSTDLDDVLYYTLWGKADQSCIAIDVDGQGWSWSSSDESKASVVVDPSAPLYTDSRATVTAHEHTAPEAVEISATAEIDTGSGGTSIFAPTSDLIVDLADPQVTYREPECEESCVNAGIRADFNRQMDQTTYPDGFHLLECLNIQDPNCIATQEVFAAPGDFDLSSATSLRYQPSSLLKPNTRYKIMLTEEIKSLGRLDPPLQGKSLQPVEWFFKTKNDGTPCAASDVEVLPHPFTAYQIGEKTSYIAIPYSSPNQCNPNGQALDPYTETYNWSTVDAGVADVTNFNTSYGKQNYCSAACLPKGSHVPNTIDQSDLLLCGNEVVDPGEDCDIGTDGAVGQSCTLNCLRPGNVDEITCGNGVVETLLGEQCDPADPETGIFCSDSCLLLGAAAETAAGACGNGVLELNEACDPGISLAEAEAAGLPASASAVGCSDQCLHVGTPVIDYWCAPGDTSEFCAGSFSICGNGIIERGEECEPGLNGADETTCTNRCLLQNVCGTALQQCKNGDEGCSDDCTWAGASSLYSTPSVCGDGVIGIGEYDGLHSCEGAVADPSAGAGPLQIVTAVGEGDVDGSGQQTTQVNASLASDAATQGAGDYTLQCGFTELTQPVQSGGNALYNDCPANADNTLGVGNNSCCMLRSVRTEEYPLDGAGFAGTEKVCRNTFIEATFNGEIQRDTVSGNVVVASGHSDPGYDCSSEGGQNNTELIEQSLALADVGHSDGFFKTIWEGIKRFFVRLFGGEAYATTFGASIADINVWCTGSVSVSPDVEYVYDENGAVQETKIQIEIGSLLASDQVYAVMLRGGQNGITDTNGVGIKNADNAERNDVWVFETGNQICKIKDVVVDPSNYLFQTPLETAPFSARAVSEQNNQQIVPTPGYSWEWSWAPTDSPLFAIPAAGAATNTPNTVIGATTVPGSLTGVASAHVTEDVDTANNQVGRTFSGTTELTSIFCERPWPGFDDQNMWESYTDELFNFSMSYCADAGVTGNDADDLPFLSVLSVEDIDGATGLDLPGSEPEVATIPGNCSMHPEQACFEDTDCPIVYNMPFGQGPDAGFTQQCHYSLNYSELVANGCTLYDFPTGRYCRRTSSYPPIYDSTYRSCETSADCEAEESCLEAGSISWKKQSTCEGVTTQVVEPEPPPSGGEGITAEDILQKKFFFNNLNSDVIGLQIFRNPDRLSARDWFVQKFGTAEGLQQINVAGYDAVSDGANYYINALNKPAVATPESTVYSNIYLIAINPNAQSNTRSVFEQLLNSLAFNINITDYGYCLADDAGSNMYTTPENYVDGMQCSSDIDCLDPGGNPLAGTNGVCSNVKTKFFRDWERLQDIEDIQGALSADAPTLAGGSYIPNYTVSRWPSWNALGGLPVDPLNVWTACDADDQQTCWTPSTFTYSCPAFAQVYEYEYDAVSGSYQIHAPFEYFNSEPALEGQFSEFISDPSAFTLDRTCVGQTLSAFGGECGDGVVNPGEQCDPPGSAQVVSSICPVGQVATATCSASCTWEYGECASGAVCGNGKVEAGEVCDDGSLNGTYGQCNTDCKEVFSAYCGNGVVDGANEFCEKVDAVQTSVEVEGAGRTRLVYGSQVSSTGCGDNFFCNLFVAPVLGALQNSANNPAVQSHYCQNDTRLLCNPDNGNADCLAPSDAYVTNLYTAEPTDSGFFDTFSDNSGDWQNYGPCVPKPGNLGSAYNQYQNLSCRFDCQGPGGYCGDGIVQSDFEDCDDGNTANGDACPSSCQLVVPKVCSYQLDQPSCQVDADCPVSLFDNGERVNLPLTQPVCMYQESLIYVPGVGNEVQAFSCQSASDCRSENTYGGFASGKELLTVTGATIPFEGDDVFFNSDNFDCINLDGSESFLGVETAACVPEEDYAPPAPEPTPGSCGDGVVNAGETCDLGDQNGLACNPEYNEACTYCSFDCQNVITVDPVAYCGNGMLDKITDNPTGQNDIYEQCETNVAGQSVWAVSGYDANGEAIIASQSCPDKGTITCGSCTAPSIASCVQCGVTFDGSKPTPRLALINPMIKDANNWPMEFFVALYRTKASPDGGLDNSILGFIDHLDGSGAEVNPEEYNQFQDSTTAEIDPDMGIESSALCSADYGISLQGSATTIDFDYPVSGQVGEVRNELVYSPAVPPGVYRVVVRWGPDTGNQNLFAGGVYTEENQQAPNTTYAKALQPLGTSGSDSLCQSVVQDPAGYWTPSSVSGHVCGAYAADSVFVHPQHGLQSTFIQSFTIDTNNATSDFGFYVQALGLSRIAADKFSDIRVELYEARQGQDPASSVYPPTAVFTIQNSAGTTSNQSAKYWHVFNLENVGGAYEVVPVESIETDECQLKQNIPDANIDGCF